MRLLLLTDVHGEVERLERLLDEAGEVDQVLFAGDITDFGPPEVAEEVLEVLMDAAPTLAVPGNCDPPSIDDVLEEKGVAVDGELREVDGFDVFGLGGSNTTPFGTPREYEEDEIRLRLESAREAEQPWILLSHAPPHKSLDLTSGAHVGSKAVLEAVRELEPKLVATGHVHEARGEMYLGGSYVVNPGPVMSGRGALVDLDPEVDEPELKLLKVK